MYKIIVAPRNFVVLSTLIVDISTLIGNKC